MKAGVQPNSIKGAMVLARYRFDETVDYSTAMDEAACTLDASISIIHELTQRDDVSMDVYGALYLLKHTQTLLGHAGMVALRTELAKTGSKGGTS